MPQTLSETERSLIRKYWAAANYLSVGQIYLCDIFAFHGYPWLTYRRTGHDNIHVRGYKEEGTTTTPFDMCVLNDLDRFTWSAT